MKISVIIPIDKNEYITRALISLQRQTFGDFQVIGVYDKEVCTPFEEVCKMDKRFWPVMGNGKGAGAARNIGLSNALGEYIVFLDSDDFFAEDMLENAYRRMTEDELDVCIWNVSEYDDVTKTYNYDTVHFRKELFPQKKVFSGNKTDFLFSITSGAPWNKMFKRELIVNNGIHFMEQDRFNDLFFTFVCLYKANRIGAMDTVGTFYRINNVYSLQGTKELSILDSVNAFNALYSRIKADNAWKDSIRRSMLNYVLSCSFALLESSKEFKSYQLLFNYIKQSEILAEMQEEDTFYFNHDLYERLQKLKDEELLLFLFNEKRKEIEVRIPVKLDSEDCYPEDYFGFKYSDYRLREIEKSFSYRLSKSITFIPRIIKDLFHKE